MSSTLNTHMQLEPAPKFCLMCGAPLKTLRTRRRTVHTLTSTIEVTLVEKACGDTGCATPGAPSAGWPLSPNIVRKMF